MIYVYTKQGKTQFTSTQDFITRNRTICEQASYLNPYLRDEIANFPVVENLIGPMYDGQDEFGGTKVRYESQEIYDILST